MIRWSWKIYSVAAAVLVVSFVATWLATTELLKAILSIPGVAAMVFALYQFVRDEAAHVKALDLQDRQQLFNLGVTSHMANIAFDKHIEFAEKYISTMQKGLTKLSATGPQQDMAFADELARVRLSFQAWITDDIEATLMSYEAAVRKMAATKGAFEAIQPPPGPERKRLVNEIYQAFTAVTGIKWEGQIDEELAPRKIMSHLQDLLEVRQLSRLRRAAVEAAIDTLKRTLGCQRR